MAEKQGWFYNRYIVIVSLLLFGPFAFPLLWKSSSFSRFWKIFWTAAIIVLTVYMLLGTWKAVEYILARFGEITV